jgi:hypothetical protein
MAGALIKADFWYVRVYLTTRRILLKFGTSVYYLILTDFRCIFPVCPFQFIQNLGTSTFPVFFNRFSVYLSGSPVKILQNLGTSSF